MSKTQIVKVQKPLSPPLDGPWLIYPESRYRVRRQVPTPEMRQLVGDELKTFCNATYKLGEGWVLHSLAPWQDW